jgi:dienelactone hydrolase
LERWLKEGGLKNGGLDAGFTAHPSFVDEEEVRGIRGPLSIAAAGTSSPLSLHPTFPIDENSTLPKIHKNGANKQNTEIDNIFSVEKRRETEHILAAHTVPYQISLYGGTEHGFGVKGDLSHRKARFAKEQAFLQAVMWLDEYVKVSDSEV